ncbi:MAG: formylglycine-generating enzyme family protein [Caldilinea sp.]|nr:formylglycine-generating enzyme family protein [Caldilinea sp.]
MSSQSTPPDPRRRSLWSIFTDPDAAAEFGRQAGRALRELRDALDPPAVSVEEFQAVQARVAALETEVATLRAEKETEREENEAFRTRIEAILQEGVARDQEILAALKQLAASPSPRNRAEMQVWRNLRGTLWDALRSILIVASWETVTALYQAWVQEELYPDAKDLVDHVLKPRLEQPSAPPTVAETPSELEIFEPAQPSDPTRWHALAPEMVYIPPGWFWMGSDKRRDPDAWEDETPLHQVFLNGYWIGRYPVTVAQFAAFVDETGYRTRAEERGYAYIWTGSTWRDVHGANWRHPRGPESDVRNKQEHPVTCVTWRDAQAYCDWLTRATGRRYRLPTEAEWEKAARGVDGRIYPWGNEKPTKVHCNFDMNVGDTTPVGSYPKGASPYGMLDAAGNVWEWTNSLFTGYPYDTTDGREDSHSEERRTVRGGSFYYLVGLVRCACRYRHIDPYFNVGFRVASPGSEDSDL